MCVGAGDKENEESWTKVSPSKNKQQQSHANNQSDPISKFCVANIPDGSPWDLGEVLKGFGNIAGVFIARKRNKEGLRFGFVNPDSLVKEIVVQVEDEFSDLSFAYNRALVARCSSFEMVNSLFSLLSPNDRGVRLMQYLGGLFVLLNFDSEVDAKNFDSEVDSEIDYMDLDLNYYSIAVI